MIRIAVTGPESCGKTTLAEALAKHFSAPFIPEFAREYLLSLSRPYNQDDLDQITEGHLKSISATTAPLQIVDTDFVVMKVWSKYKYGNCSEFIHEQVKTNYFDLHLLCSPDIPWEEDELREHPEEREKLFEIYVDQLTRLEKPFVIIKGTEKDRLQQAISAIQTLLPE